MLPWEQEIANGTKPAKFWMVSGSGNQPRIRHYTKRDAEQEAARLATANPGNAFYVLEAVESFEQPTSMNRTKL